ncbi:rho guanine nucleotide exchange factor 28-like [Myripristis murdjan]|uniref:rho guanine nucleotide exchange factor 28-like n=1 Tax=Myripristis murdjan TaxID=586833 RepID=UPI001175D1F1|nr:rho guanine nucleotide exchange factor 28-like [Myripristis murdjan]
MDKDMELSRRDAPLYGQVEAQVTFQNRAPVPAEAEFYVVLQGSRLMHIMSAKRRTDGLALCFTVPGHDLAEAVSVTSYFHTEDGVKPCGGEASLEYITDVAQDVAQYLCANRSRLTPQSYLEILGRFATQTEDADEHGGREDELCRRQSDREDEDVLIKQRAEDETGLRVLDVEITQAFANMDYPQSWRGTDSQPREVAELQPKETLLHLAVRLDLLHLSRFLIHQPRGQRALTLPNQEGDTPLQLAQKGGEHALFSALATPPVPVVGPVAGVWCVWSDTSSMLRFCPGTDSLSLAVQQTAGNSPEDGIVVLRERLGDDSVLKLIAALRGDADAAGSDREDGHAADGDLGEELHVDEHVLLSSVFEEQLVLSLDDDDDEEYPSALPAACGLCPYPLASTMTQSECPGICPVTETKTGMGAGWSHSNFCLSQKMPPFCPLYPAVPSPSSTPGAGQWISVIEVGAGMFYKLKCPGLTR